ncbi:hypothetical protein EVAR_90581_1 [Eumeta japonica]|uniref:Uncharacterized protein n=1 Tax=Eumeta variegata TaxID=151549 RepID=A0A4C2A3R3_EUMVA|nr:hypothetical protein EVAR_90581_1 [Eumeta japonica]
MTNIRHGILSIFVHMPRASDVCWKNSHPTDILCISISINRISKVNILFRSEFGLIQPDECNHRCIQASWYRTRATSSSSGGWGPTHGASAWSPQTAGAIKIVETRIVIYALSAAARVPALVCPGRRTSLMLCCSPADDPLPAGLRSLRVLPYLRTV